MIVKALPTLAMLAVTATVMASGVVYHHFGDYDPRRLNEARQEAAQIAEVVAFNTCIDHQQAVCGFDKERYVAAMHCQDIMRGARVVGECE